MAIAFIDRAAFADSNNGATTGAIDTTGATLLVVVAAYYNLGGAITLSDSKGNSWTLIRAVASGGEVVVGVYYSVPTSVGASHTVTWSQTSMYGSLNFHAFSGTHASTPLDGSGAQNASTTGTSIQAGSVTPGQDDSLVIAALGSAPSSTAYSINGGFTGIVTGGGGYERAGTGYLIQTTAAAANPTWSWSNSWPNCAGNDVFKPAAGGGGTTRGMPFGTRSTAFNGGRTFAGVLR